MVKLLRILVLLAAGVFSLSANPFHEAEQAFLDQLNSISGIELFGGPFRSGEQHHFEGESGYFIPAPAFAIPTLDQRLSVQTKQVDLATFPSSPSATASNHPLPIATAPYRPNDLSAADRQQIHALLARPPFATTRDEITAFSLANVHIRPVTHLPIIALNPLTNHSSPAAHHYVALLGAQPWQGVPLYRARFDRFRGQFDLLDLRDHSTVRLPPELPLRPAFLTPQTFFADPGLDRADWTSLLRHFATLDLPALDILDATLTERSVTLHLDHHPAIIPQFWVKLEKRWNPAQQSRENSHQTKPENTSAPSDATWRIAQAVEFRVDFYRPPVWWQFIPLLPEQPAPPHLFPDSPIPHTTRREILNLVARLRGVGPTTSIDSTHDHQTVVIRTTRYHLHFTHLQDTWRLTTVTPQPN